MSSYLFCNFKLDEFIALHEAISKVFNFTQDELKNLYHTMREELEIADYPGDKPWSRSLFNSGNQSFASRYDEALVIGVDIPSTFELADGNKNKKTIVILGQDPLRGENKRVDDILIGTPYGFHQKGCREKHKNTKFYFQLIKVLLDKGYRVYLTDVFKIWISDSQKSRDNIGIDKRDKERFIEVLKLEMEFVKPELLITWGRIATNTTKQINLPIKHLSFPHPSNAYSSWAKIMGKRGTRANILEFWQDQILSNLL